MINVSLRAAAFLTLFVHNGTDLFGQSSRIAPSADTIICPSKYTATLLWRDDFEGTQLDTSLWTSYYPFGPGGSDSCSFCRTHSTIEKRENQVFLDANVVLEKGMARLEVRKERATWYEFSERFTSGVIYARKPITAVAWRAEIRARVPTSKGIWPAFWMFGGSTEIDVFEFYGRKSGRQPSLEHFESSVHHWDNDSPRWGDLWTHAPDAADSFHIYGVEVTSSYIAFYLDGREIGRMTKFSDANGEPVTGCMLQGSAVYTVADEFPQAGAQVSVIAGVGVRRKPRRLPPPMVMDWIAVWVLE